MTAAALPRIVSPAARVPVNKWAQSAALRAMAGRV
jgi:hypothetical protein